MQWSGGKTHLVFQQQQSFYNTYIWIKCSCTLQVISWWVTNSEPKRQIITAHKKRSHDTCVHSWLWDAHPCSLVLHAEDFHHRDRFKAVAQLKRVQSSKFCRRRSTPCKGQLSLPFGAIPGSECKMEDGCFCFVLSARNGSEEEGRGGIQEQICRGSELLEGGNCWKKGGHAHVHVGFCLVPSMDPTSPHCYTNGMIFL